MFSRSTTEKPEDITTYDISTSKTSTEYVSYFTFEFTDDEVNATFTTEPVDITTTKDGSDVDENDVLEWYYWLAIGVAVLLIIVIIIGFCCKRRFKKKKQPNRMRPKSKKNWTHIWMRLTSKKGNDPPSHADLNPARVPQGENNDYGPPPNQNRDAVAASITESAISENIHVAIGDLLDNTHGNGTQLPSNNNTSQSSNHIAENNHGNRTTQALYYDPEDPIFKVLPKDKDGYITMDKQNKMKLLKDAAVEDTNLQESSDKHGYANLGNLNDSQKSYVNVLDWLPNGQPPPTREHNDSVEMDEFNTHNEDDTNPAYANMLNDPNSSKQPQTHNAHIHAPQEVYYNLNTEHGVAMS